MNITNQKIVSYLKGEGTSWLTKFTKEMTLGELFEIISNPESVITFEEYSEAFAEKILNHGFKVDNMNITGIITEEGQMIRLKSSMKYGRHQVLMVFEGEIDEKWKDQFEELKNYIEGKETNS